MIDPSLLAGAMGLALGVGVACGWLLASRRARAAREREGRAAEDRAREAVAERTVRRARTRAPHDLLMDARGAEGTRGGELPATPRAG